MNAIVDEIATKENFGDYVSVFKEEKFTGDNYMGDIARIQIKSPKNTKNAINLILKSAHGSPSIRERVPINTFYATEVFIYETVLPCFRKHQEASKLSPREKISFAKIYKASLEHYKEFLILKDLTNDGYILHDKKIPFDKEHSVLAVKKIANLHAVSFAMKQKNPELFRRLQKKLPHTSNYGAGMMEFIPHIIKSILQIIECPFNKNKLECFKTDTVLDNALDAESTEPYNTICHGDCWNNNMLFKYSDGALIDVILIDWQIARFASPVTDLIYMVFLSMDESQIDSNFEDILNIYYETLSTSLSDLGCDVTSCYPERVFREHLKMKMIFGLFMAICALPQTLSDPDEAKSVEEMSENMDNGVSNVKVSDVAAKRINGIVNYFVKNNII